MASAPSMCMIAAIVPISRQVCNSRAVRQILNCIRGRAFHPHQMPGHRQRDRLRRGVVDQVIGSGRS